MSPNENGAMYFVVMVWAPGCERWARPTTGRALELGLIEPDVPGYLLGIDINAAVFRFRIDLCVLHRFIELLALVVGGQIIPLVFHRFVYVSEGMRDVEAQQVAVERFLQPFRFDARHAFFVQAGVIGQGSKRVVCYVLPQPCLLTTVRAESHQELGPG